MNLSDTDIVKALRSITNSAGMGGYGISYRSTNTQGKTGQWAIDRIVLVDKGNSTDMPGQAGSGGHQQKDNKQDGETVKKSKTIEKEPYFDRRLNRYVEVVKGEVLARFSKNVTKEEIERFHKEKGTQTLKSYEKISVHRLKIPETETVWEFVEKHSMDVKQAYIEPVFLASQQAVMVNDPSFKSQWAIPLMQVDKAWEINSGSPDMIVAVIDTGIDISHPDLKNKVISGVDIVNGNSAVMDDNGHGTYVSGIIAAEANNSIGVAGISWKSRLMPVKVLTASGEGSYSDLIEGIIYAVDHGARIQNLSLGGYSYSQFLGDAVQYAHSNRAVIVAAGGNENTVEQLYPAAYPNVIAVSATDPSDQRWPLSNYGSYIRLSAPGVGILSTQKGNSYGEATGTSVSTAHVSGVAALILSKNPDFSNTQVENILYQTADDLGDKGWDSYFGFGRVNALKAIEMGGIEVHDVAIADIKISPETFKAGEATKIIVTVENQGTFAEKNLSVKVSVNGEPVEEVMEITTIKQSDSIDINFAWMPVSGANELVEIMAQIEEIENEIELEDNIKTVRYNYVYSPETDIVTLYTICPPVHQWIGLQAYNKLRDNSPIKNEIKQYLPTDASSDYYSTKFSSILNCFSETYDDLQAPRDPKSALIEGVWEEDLDLFENGCFVNNYQDPNNPFKFDFHYWDPDKNEGMNNCNSAFKDAVEDRFAKGLNYYRLNLLDQAYYWLGRTAHLLMDMSVPAHTLMDPHAIPLMAGDDSYEDYTGLQLHYKEIHSGSLNTEIPDITNLQDLPYPLPDSSDGRGDLAKLFYNLAQISNDFDSDDANGKSLQFGNGKFRFARGREALMPGKVVSRVEYWYWGLIYDSKIRDLTKLVDYDIVQNDCEYRIYFYQSFYDLINNTPDYVNVIYTDGTSQSISKPPSDLDENLLPDIFEEPLKCIYQPALQARAIGHVAALYQLFWDTTHSSDTTITAQPLNPTNTTSATFNFTSTDAGSAFQCQLDNGGYTICTSPMIYTGLADGSHTFYVKATDVSGNTDPTPASYTWTIDATPPVTTASPRGGTFTSAQTVTLSAGELATIFYTSDGTTPTIVSSSIYSVPINISATTTLKFFAMDSLGNSETVKTETYTITCTPTSKTTTFISPTSNFKGATGVAQTIMVKVMGNCNKPVKGSSITVTFNNGDNPVTPTDKGEGYYSADWSPQHTGTVTITVNDISITGKIGTTPGPVVDEDETYPYNGAAINDNHRVPMDTSIRIRMRDSDGIDFDTIQMMVEGKTYTYNSASDNNRLRIKEVQTGDRKDIWVLYDPAGGEFSFDQIVGT